MKIQYVGYRYAQKQSLLCYFLCTCKRHMPIHLSRAENAEKLQVIYFIKLREGFQSNCNILYFCLIFGNLQNFLLTFHSLFPFSSLPLYFQLSPRWAALQDWWVLPALPGVRDLPRHCRRPRHPPPRHQGQTHANSGILMLPTLKAGYRIIRCGW